MRNDGTQGVILQNVPANRRYFNKGGTNLMVRCPRPDVPTLVAVDHDLLYIGTDPVLQRAFTGGTTQQGWRILFIEPRASGSFTDIVEDALRLVGFEDEEPAWKPGCRAQTTTAAAGERAGLRVIDRFGRGVDAVAIESGVRGRSSAENALAAVIGVRPRLPVFVGPPGGGKSHALACFAALLPTVAPGARVTCVDLGRLFLGTLLESERENLLASVLEEAAAEEHLVLALERLELVVQDTRHGTFALAAAVERGQRVIGTIGSASAAVFDETVVARHLHAVTAGAVSIDEACAILRGELERISAHHHVAVPDVLVRPMAERAATLSGCLPATVLALADVACARARLEGRSEVGIAQVCGAASTFARDQG